MISADGARQHGGHGEHHDLSTHIAEDGDSDGDQNSEGAPRGAGGKGQAQGDQEEDAGHQGMGHLVSVDHLADKAAGVKVILSADAGKGPGQRQDQDRRNHGFKAFHQAGGKLAEGDAPSGDIQQKYQYDGEKGA